MQIARNWKLTIQKCCYFFFFFASFALCFVDPSKYSRTSQTTGTPVLLGRLYLLVLQTPTINLHWLNSQSTLSSHGTYEQTSIKTRTQSTYCFNELEFLRRCCWFRLIQGTLRLKLRDQQKHALCVVIRIVDKRMVDRIEKNIETVVHQRSLLIPRISLTTQLSYWWDRSSLILIKSENKQWKLRRIRQPFKNYYSCISQPLIYAHKIIDLRMKLILETKKVPVV